MPASLYVERRTHRIDTPECAHCDHHPMVVAYRTPYVVYFRCEDCGRTQSVRKPGWQPDNSSA